MSDEPTEYRQVRFSVPPGATELLLIRHGESEAARPGETFSLADGHGDPALAPEGRAQAVQLGARLAREKVDALYVTSLRRTQETAAPLVRQTGLVPVIEPDLREVFLGEWEGGRYRQKAAQRDPLFLRAVTEEEWGLIPGGESNEQLRARVLPAIERIARSHPDRRVAVVSHGGVIGCILAVATGSRPFAFTGADNGSISHIVVMGERWLLRRFNDTGHLDGELSIEGDPPA